MLVILNGTVTAQITRHVHIFGPLRNVLAELVIATSIATSAISTTTEWIASASPARVVQVSKLVLILGIEDLKHGVRNSIICLESAIGHEWKYL